MASSAESKNMSKSSGSKAKVDCMICAEEVSQRKMVKCPFCEFEACRDCTEQFLMGIDDDKPRCMENSCKKVWSFEFLSSNFMPNFHNKKYRDRRAVLLHEREKSLLPGTQPLVKAEKQKEKNNKKIAAILDENEMYKALIGTNIAKIRKLRNSTHTPEKKKEKKTFTRACPVEECRGFLSSGLKCGTCSTFACKDCHLAKASKRDDEHKCDPDLVATVKLLADDTKPCPACATPIFKIHGCDQMYCTQCHTPFSWKNGTIERGVIHNPHYYEAQRAMNGGVAPRNQGDMRCGGPPFIGHVFDKMTSSGDACCFGLVREAHRLINHINLVEIPRYPNTLVEVDNSKLRLDYLMNRITEKQWVSKLKSQMKKKEKNGEYNMVLGMFTTTLSDLMGNIVECENHDVCRFVVAIGELRAYTNKALMRIGIRYGNVYPCITETYVFCANSRKSGNPKKVRGQTPAQMPPADVESDDEELGWEEEDY